MSRRQTALTQGAAEPNPLRWHAAVTNFGAEFSVREALQARGIDTVLPVIRFWRIRNRKRVIAERPVFPRCVFFGMDHDTQSLIDFVSRYVRSDDGRSIIRKDEPARARSIVGIERIVRDADGNWASSRRWRCGNCGDRSWRAPSMARCDRIERGPSCLSLSCR